MRLYLSTFSLTPTQRQHCRHIVLIYYHTRNDGRLATEREGTQTVRLLCLSKNSPTTAELNFGLQMIYYLTSSNSWIDGWTNRSLMAANYKLPIHSHTLDSKNERKAAKWTVGKSASNLYFMLIVERLLFLFSRQITEPSSISLFSSLYR